MFNELFNISFEFEWSKRSRAGAGHRGWIEYVIEWNRDDWITYIQYTQTHIINMHMIEFNGLIMMCNHVNKHLIIRIR